MSNWGSYEKPTTSPRVHLTRAELEREELKRQSQLLLEETNRTFKELTSTLSQEQIRLTELEEKRKRLLNQMLDLKADIEREKEACRLELLDTATEEEAGLDPWYGLTEDEVDRKQKLSIHASGSAMLTRKPHFIDTRRSSIDISNEIVERLEGLVSRGSSHDPY